MDDFSCSQAERFYSIFLGDQVFFLTCDSALAISNKSTVFGFFSNNLEILIVGIITSLCNRTCALRVPSRSHLCKVFVVLPTNKSYLRGEYILFMRMNYHGCVYFFATINYSLKNRSHCA